MKSKMFPRKMVSSNHEYLLDILPLVSGESPAAFGDFGGLQKFASATFPSKMNCMDDAR